MQTISEQLDGDYYYRSWPVHGNVKAVVVLVHGLGEHCQRYDALANYLGNQGYAVCGMDLPSHGNSSGTPGHINRFSQFSDAVLSLYARTRAIYPDLPVFLLGHSMGGLISANLLLDHQDKFRGALLSSAAIQSPQEPPAWQVSIIKAIAAILPKTPVLALDASGISRDPAVVEAYMCDPLVSKSKLSARFLLGLRQTMDRVLAEASQITLPILIMHGGADVMTAPEGSEKLFSCVASQDKQLKIYPGLYHEIFNEPEAESVYADVLAWLDAHTS
ncbi:alpha/beta hydrolase [Arenicella chitinivorans]|nr:alpha/beta hydrolase [Arenicella chitinivorans]